MIFLLTCPLLMVLFALPHSLTLSQFKPTSQIEIEIIEIEIVYNMYRMRRFFTKKPDASATVSWPSQLRHTGNLQVRARP
jgi:hypothetical protein